MSLPTGANVPVMDYAGNLYDPAAALRRGYGVLGKSVPTAGTPETIQRLIYELADEVERRSEESIDAAHIERQRTWSRKNFGPGPRTEGIVDHIRKELGEVLDDPHDLGEWVDLIILAVDGAWRAGHEPQAIIRAVKAKQARNEVRVWPDWRTAPEGQAIEHDRSYDEQDTR